MESVEETMRAYPDDSEGGACYTQGSRDVHEGGSGARETWPGDLEAAERERFLARHSQLHRMCQHIFADIHRNFTDLNDLLVLTDAEGRLICLHCSHEVLAAATRNMGLRCGVTLTESSCGSDAITLALRYRETMISVRPAHQHVPFSNPATVAVPLLDADQNVVGCLAIFNAGEGSLGEKLLLAKFIAREISRVRLLYAEDLTAAVQLSPRGVLDGAAECRREEVTALPPPGLMERRRSERRRTQRAAATGVTLTRRQLQTLQLFAQGKGYKEIARDMGITSYKTVEEHLDAVREKLQVAHRRECIQKAISLGLL